MATSNSVYLNLCRAARIPKRYWDTNSWSRLRPSWLKSSRQNTGHWYTSLSEADQVSWFSSLQSTPELFDKPYQLVILGNFTSGVANQVAFGLGTHALKNGRRVQCYHPGSFKFGDLDQPKDAARGKRRACVNILYGLHTDDTQARRQLARDFCSPGWAETTFRILVLSGEKPLEFLYFTLGLRPHAVLHFPGDPWKKLSGFSPKRRM